MKPALLDTMAVLWMIYDPERLSRAAVERITDADSPLYYSIVSLWEIGLKVGKGGFNELGIEDGWESFISDGMKQQGIERVGVEPVHCAHISSMPFHHGDPFDRMIFAQAEVAGWAIVSKDRLARRYLSEVIW